MTYQENNVMTDTSTESKYEITSTPPELPSKLGDNGNSPRADPLSRAIRRLKVGEWLKLPEGSNLNSIRSMAYTLGTKATPLPLKYPVVTDVHGQSWVGCKDWPDDMAYPDGRERTPKPLTEVLAGILDDPSVQGVTGTLTDDDGYILQNDPG